MFNLKDLDLDHLPDVNFSTLGLLLPGLFLIWYLVSSVYSWYRLRHIPGPFLGSFSYTWIAKTALGGRTGYELLRQQKKAGSLLRVAPNYLLTDDPQVFRKVNAARGAYHRDGWYGATRVDPRQDHLISILDTAEHDRMKAKVAHGYNGRDMDVNGAVDSIVTLFIDTIRSRYLTHTQKEGDSVERGGLVKVDFAALARYFTLDVITRVSYGQEFGFIAAGRDLYSYTRSMEQFIVVLTIATDVPLIRRIVFSPLMAGLMPKHTDESGLGKVLGIARKIVGKRYDEEVTGERDMIGSFMRAGLTRIECEAETGLQIIAATDTTAGAIRSTMVHLLTSPPAYARLKSEVRKAVESGVSFPITLDQARKLPYLQAVIWEGLRMRPPAVYGHYKVVPPGGDTLNGVFIPGGTAIGHNMTAMMRNEAVFGQDVDVFRPERYLECDADKKAEAERVVDLVFGAGRWTCAGKTVAFTELNKVFFELFRAFDFQLINATNPCRENAYVVWVQSNMWVRITEVT
ncbi:cytochrome P450 [Diplogelasinospora grovesii]|uniref:Cytochrome P450 n=1 Tax=Diplogelasinospora grovesii TaxID=303347 RepID=A0AAN6N772_9PEZI|nr:cytochrome P450 [Diplogelasinospora grovesii]